MKNLSQWGAVAAALLLSATLAGAQSASGANTVNSPSPHYNPNSPKTKPYTQKNEHAPDDTASAKPAHAQTHHRRRTSSATAKKSASSQTNSGSATR